jgi:hypothetical protein
VNRPQKARCRSFEKLCALDFVSAVVGRAKVAELTMKHRMAAAVATIWVHLWSVCLVAREREDT